MVGFPAGFVATIYTFYCGVRLRSVSIIALTTGAVHSSFFYNVGGRNDGDVALLLPHYDCVVSAELFFIIIVATIITITTIGIGIGLYTTVQTLNETVLGNDTIRVCDLTT